jgi:hypothetical protein
MLAEDCCGNLAGVGNPARNATGTQRRVGHSTDGLLIVHDQDRRLPAGRIHGQALQDEKSATPWVGRRGSDGKGYRRAGRAFDYFFFRLGKNTSLAVLPSFAATTLIE